MIRIGAAAGLVAAALPIAIDHISASATDPGVNGGSLVIWARDEVKLDRDSSVTSGSFTVDVVTQNAVAPGQHSVRMVSGAATGPKVRVIGDLVTIDASATAGGDVYYQTLANNGTIGGGQFGSLMVPVPIADPPSFRTGTPGPTNVTVPRNGSMTITPGAYGDVMVDRNASLVLMGAGDYAVRSITMARGASISVEATASVEVLVKERFTSGPGGSFGPAASAPISADNIVVYVEGASDTIEASGRIGNGVVFGGTMYVRMNGPELTVGSNAAVTGALFGTRVKLDRGASLDAASFFGGADLSITKTDSPDPAISGEQLTYTITVSNDGPQEATNVVVTDTLPTEVSGAATSGCGNDPAGVPNCNLGDIAAGGSAQFTITVDVDAGLNNVTITNSASVASDRFDPDLSNNSTTEDTLVVEPTADLSIAKSDDVDPVVAGDTVVYTVTVANAGPQAAPNVVVTDTLPAGLTPVATSGCAEDPIGVPTCSLGTIAPGGSAQYTIEVIVDAGVVGTLTNAASVVSDITDPDGGNNSTTEDTEALAVADLSISKADDVDPVIAGDTVIYTVTVDNAGPQAATNVVVTDTLPAGVTLVATTGCAEDPTGVPTCSLGTIASGGSAQYTIEVTVDSGVAGTLTNAASVTSDTFDPDTGNNTITEDTVADPTADLSITKSDDVDPVFPGDTVIYTVTVNNAGPQAATNVVVTDTLPAGVTLVATTGCGEDPIGVPTCSLGTIASGGSAQYTIEVTVDAGTSGTITNGASVTSDTFDPDGGNNSTGENTFVATPTADLSITKVDDVDPNVAGGTLVYTVTVSNAGPQAASNVVVTDTLPAGVTLVTTTGCGEDPTGVPTCSMGTIAPGGSAQYTIEVTVNSGTSGVITNSASVTSDTFDNNLGNNSTAEDTTVAAPPTAADDAPAANSAPGDNFHTALNTTLTTVDGSAEDILVNDNLGFPAGALTSFGGGDLGGAVTDNAAGSTVAVGAGSLTVNADGTLTFTPDTDFTGLFSFVYRLTNAAGTSDATVTIAVGVRPAATTDSRNAIGNVGLDTSLTPVFSVLANDAGDQITVTAMDATSTNGGSVTHLGGGQFTYDPAPGFEGSDSFGYTMGNGFGTVGGTVNVSVNNVIWFIDNSAGAPGDGRINAPFNTLAGFNAGAADEPGDIIFIEETGNGNYTGGISLLDNQIVVGNGATASIDAVAGMTLPPNSRPLPLSGGSSPTIADSGAGNGITLASGNTIRGLNVVNGGGGSGVHGASVGTLSISEVASVTSSGGPGLVLSGGTWNVTIGLITVTSSSTGGISLSTGPGSTTNLADVDIATSAGTGLSASNAGTLNVTTGTIDSPNGSAVDIGSTALGITLESVSSNGGSSAGIVLSSTSGSFSVTGSGVPGTGGTISGKTGNVDGVSLTSATNVSLSYMGISNNSRNGVFGSNVNNLTLTDSFINGNADQTFPDEAGILLSGFTGTIDIIDSTVSNSHEHNIKLESTSGTATINVTGSTVGPNPAGTGAQGLLVDTAGTANVTLNVSGSAFNGNQSNGIFADTAGGTLDVTVQTSTFSNNNVGVGVSASNTGTLTFDVVNNPSITGNRAVGVRVFTSASHDSTAVGTISGNTVGTNGVLASGSLLGSGIAASNEGSGTMTLLIDANTVQEVGNGLGSGFEGIFVIGSVNAGTTNATVTNNLIDQVRDDRGINVRSTADTVCADIQGNALTNIFNATSNIRVSQALTGVMNVRQTSLADITAQNGGATATMGGTVNFNQGACAQP